MPVAAQGTLQFVAGLLVIGVGLWLLLRRATGQAAEAATRKPDPAR